MQVIVFCTTARVTGLVARLLGELNLNIREIHSRKAQTYRTRVSDEFRKSKGLILVTSDVSARGVDYPDVTLVIQVYLCYVSTFTEVSDWTSVFVQGPKGKKGLAFHAFIPIVFYTINTNLTSCKLKEFLCPWHNIKSLSKSTLAYRSFKLF